MQRSGRSGRYNVACVMCGVLRVEQIALAPSSVEGLEGMVLLPIRCHVILYRAMLN